jgi:thiamine biosynthesis protein ThiS
MRVTVNGEPREVAPGATLLDLVRESGSDPGRAAVAVNGAVVPRGELATRRPAEGDAIELIEPVGGG